MYLHGSTRMMYRFYLLAMPSIRGPSCQKTVAIDVAVVFTVTMVVINRTFTSRFFAGVLLHSDCI